MGIGSKHISAICIVVWDIDKAERHWNRVLGFQAERLKTPVFEQVPSFTDGKADSFNDEIEFLVYRLENDSLIEIFPPGPGDTPWRRFLDKYGEGVMSFGIYVPDRQEAYREIKAACGTDKPYHIGYYPDSTYSFVDTMDALGVQLNIKKNENNTERIHQLTKNPELFEMQGDK